MTINMLDAATYFRGLDHQVRAFRWLNTELTEKQKEEFARLYRNPELNQPPAQVKPVENTWDGVLKYAKKAGAKFPEVVAAQWALESGYGKHTSGQNNFFGLKGSGSSVGTKEFINGKWVEIKASFIDFPDIASCIQYLVDRWYKDYGSFKGVNRASNRNECAHLLVKERYATDPNYATKLIQIMDRELGKPPVGPAVINEKILSVPYFYQLDNESGKGFRECFSSSCAMIAAFYGKVKSDDEYNRIRKNFGDTTDSMAQLKTLRHLGLTAKFINNGNAAVIENEIRNGRPIAVGWLHQGSVSKPSGGGHWSIIRGFTPTHFVHGDPYGEADMVRGGYVSTKPKAGDGIRYSRKNWLRRWEVDGANTGWAILVNK
jgi:hypothetical protein